MKKSGIMVLCFLVLFIAGCSDSKSKEKVAVTLEDGVAVFANENYSLDEILEVCDTTLTEQYEVSQNCEVYEVYAYTNLEGKLLTEIQSEFEIVLSDKDTGKWFHITSDDDKNHIMISETSESDSSDAIPWSKLLHLAENTNYKELEKSEDDFYISVGVTGLISGTEVQIKEDRDSLYVIEADKMVEVSQDELEGEYNGLILSYCVKGDATALDRSSGHAVNHNVAILEAN